MNTWKIISIVAHAAILAACAQGPVLNLNDPASVSLWSKTSRDEYQKTRTLTGPNLATDSSGDTLFLRAIIPDSGGAPKYEIYVIDQYFDNWHFYESAYDSNGNKLEMTKISQTVSDCYKSGCIKNEHLIINLTTYYFGSHINTGIKFKVIGKGGEEVFSIPSAYIRGFLGRQ